MSLKQIKLGDLMARRLGNVDPSKYLDECFELYSIPAFDVKKTEILFGKEIGSSKQNVQENDVLLSKIVPHIRRSWVVKKNNGYRQIASGEWIVFRSDSVLPDYLKYVVTCDDFHAKFMQTVSGVGGSLLRARPAQVAEISIPLPPLAQQQRIAAILDKATEIKAKREQAIAKLDELAQSTFVEMFGDVVANDKCWQCVTLGSVTSKLGSGATPSGGDASYKAEGIPLIRSLNVHDGEFVYKNLAYIDDEQAQKLSNVIVQKNDVLLNITGASVARVCRVPDAVVPARVNQHVMIVRPTEKINPIFLERQLLTARMKQKLLQVGGAGATREAITKAQATELNVICPPIAAQTKFADIAKWIEKLKVQEVTGLVSLEKLTSSLQHQAFTTGFAA